MNSETILLIVLILLVLSLIVVTLVRTKVRNNVTGNDQLRKDFRDEVKFGNDTVITTLTTIFSEKQDQFRTETKDKLDGVVQNVKSSSDMNGQHIEQMRKVISDHMTRINEDNNLKIDEMRRSVQEGLDNVSKSIERMSAGNEEKLSSMRETVSTGMDKIRMDNDRKLSEIKDVVDEKLQSTLEKRITESFHAVNEQLEQVYKGIGEMKSLASEVGGLKNILSGVKTRGILGEIQLKSILDEILSVQQYEENVVTVPGSTERVEFAIKLPGTEEGSHVLLPIDSKFPGDTYAKLRDAQENGDKAEIENSYKNLERVIKSEAKEIREKYIAPPYTTNFGIMFLPFEGLYSEVVNRGLFETIQKDYQITITGPSTMAVLLNSLQMGFRTLAIQKRSHEVWVVLGSVKTEFGKFEDVLKKMQNHLNQTSNDLNTLLTTRTNSINRKLRDIQMLDEAKMETLPDYK